jgi:hypothetical protein
MNIIDQKFPSSLSISYFLSSGCLKIQDILVILVEDLNIIKLKKYVKMNKILIEPLWINYSVGSFLILIDNNIFINIDFYFLE